MFRRNSGQLSQAQPLGETDKHNIPQAANSQDPSKPSQINGDIFDQSAQPSYFSRARYAPGGPSSVQNLFSQEAQSAEAPAPAPVVRSKSNIFSYDAPEMPRRNSRVMPAGGQSSVDALFKQDEQPLPVPISHRNSFSEHRAVKSSNIFSQEAEPSRISTKVSQLPGGRSSLNELMNDNAPIEAVSKMLFVGFVFWI